MKQSLEQAEILDNYIDSLAHNPQAAPPLNLDSQSAGIVRALVEIEQDLWAGSIAEIKERAWQKALSSAQAGPETPDKLIYLNPTGRRKPRYALGGLALVASLAFLVVALSVFFAVFSGDSEQRNNQGYATPIPQATSNLTPLTTIGATPGRIASFDGPVISLDWTGNGNQLAVATPHKVYIQDQNGLTLKTVSFTQTIVKIAWAPDGQSLAILCNLGDSGKNTEVRLWQTSQPIDKSFIDNPPSPVTDFAWKPDGQRLLTLSQDKGLRYWDLSGQMIINRVTGAGVIGLSPDGKNVVVSSPNGQLNYYDAVTLEAGKKDAFKFGLGGSSKVELGIIGLAWTRDSQVLAIGYKNNIIFMNKVGTFTQQVEFKAGNITSLNWSPDGRYLAIGSESNQLTLWGFNGENIQQFAPLTRHSGPITALAWSPDGKTLVTGSSDHSIVEWTLPPAK